MWTISEYALFDQATYCISTGEYEEGAEVADRLLTWIQNDERKYAYVLGCRKAVALRHLGHSEEAAQAFNEAYQHALALNELAIASYIRNDQSAIYQGEEAVNMIREAISLCEQATNSPDPARTLPADIVYMHAALARALSRQGQHQEAKGLMRGAKRVLRQYSRGEYPRYKHAYLVVLLWELEMPGPSSLLGHIKQPWRLLRILAEMRRQKKLKTGVKRLVSQLRRS